jgi:hypothetical protein
MNPNFIELLGTFSSIIVAVSLTMRNLRWLRTVNLIGALFFSVYGLLIQAWPVFGLNAFIVFINIYYLVQMAKAVDSFSLLEIPEPETDLLLSRFLQHYAKDIRKFQPDWNTGQLQGSRVVFVLRDVIPVSVLVCRQETGETWRIILDYAAPIWRDSQNAKFFFNTGLPSLGWSKTGTLLVDTTVKVHRKYLLKVGFQENELTGTLKLDWKQN